MTIANLPKQLQPALKALEKDLLARAKTAPVEAGLKAAWEDEQKAGQTGSGFDPWRRERVTQLAVAWILSVVFVRTLEDRGYVDPRVAGATADALGAAQDREALFLQVAPFLGPREYLLAVFRELAKLPGARDVFDTKHNPVWVLSPSSEGAQALLDFFRKRDESGAPALVFGGEDTRFLGDLYQDLSEAVRKRYALLQTPEFVEEFILDQTLDPAIEEFGLKEVTLIDPTCGSGHFLLGAFRRLLGRWQKEAPTENIADLARKALDQVYGVDINPYAVAIARFRLVLALLDAVGIRRLERAPDIRLNVVVADSLLHRFDQRVLSVGRISMDDDMRWGDRLFRLENRGDVERVLTKRFHAVVGNPPFNSEPDKTKKQRYREQYESASGKFTLAAPFVERFFDLAVAAGFVGMINMNAWTKRDYGAVLVERVLARLDVSRIIDVSGAYIPNNGSRSLLLYGRNRAPSAASIPAVLGIKGERTEPSDPARAPVWSEIVGHFDELGYSGMHVSVEQFSREELSSHPWVLAGGGARDLLTLMRRACPGALVRVASTGVFGMSNADECFTIPESVAARLHLDGAFLLPVLSGLGVRDWEVELEAIAVFPYRNGALAELNQMPNIARYLWAFKTVLGGRATFRGGTYSSDGLPWWKWHQVAHERLAHPALIFYGELATHNHFSISSRPTVIKQSAPLVMLNEYESGSRENALGLLGYLNSSTYAFWGRLNFYHHGDKMGKGARLSKTPWQDRLQMAGNLLQQLPVPKLEDLRDKLRDLVIAVEATVQQLSDQEPAKVIATVLAKTPTHSALRDARTRSLGERARLRGVLVSLQEEMDWRVYGMFGLPTVTAPSIDAVRVPVEPNHRPFEVRLAREVGADISAAEWFRAHKREAPKDVGGPLVDLYRRRLRLLDDLEHGSQLRLLETPETKRRWSLPDDTKTFSNAARTWLLEHIEASFRDQTTPELRTARQLALTFGRDPAVAAAHELLTEESGLDLAKLVSDLVDSEGVPFLAGYRYTETGMEKRASWEEAWRLQRLDDVGVLTPELKRLGLRAIPLPDRYGSKDFLRHYAGFRGELDVPKERFVTVPGGNTDEDATPLVGWAGWDHLQVAQALSGLYQRRKSEDGWTKERLVPLLAGIDERVPWLLQWHNEASAAFGGMKLGEFFRDFVAAEAHGLGVAVGDLRKWTPPAAQRRATLDPAEVLAALQAWKPEVDDDADEDDDDAEPPEGPTVAELATEVGAANALVSRALRALEADGLVEKLSGRPARYVAIGGEA